MEKHYYGVKIWSRVKRHDEAIETGSNDVDAIEALLDYKGFRRNEFQKIIKFNRELKQEEAKNHGLYFLGSW